MRNDPVPLGALLKAYREQVGLTQLELAKRITPSISRSLVAHVEQGLRIPPASVVSRLCLALGIPQALWERYTMPGFSGPVREMPALEQPLVVALAGLMGSGKTTLARAIADALQFALLPEASLGLRYLKDLSQDQGRWAFETQLAFLCQKAVQLREITARGRSLILDRSLSEDVHVFAEFFRRTGKIDERAYATYSMLAEHFMVSLPPPDLIVFCQCSVDEAMRRLAARRRGDGLHTREHIEAVHQAYSIWLARQPVQGVLMVDSEKEDFRDPVVAQGIARRIFERIVSDGQSQQMQLFSAPPAPTSIALPGERMRAPAPLSEAILYLAAPFTGAEQAARDDAPKLFASPHGVIPRGGYRSMLLSVERVLRGWGIRTLLPHRDVNQWGRRPLQPAAAAKQCTEHVLGSDGIVALLGTSHGAHYELGLAAASDKPCIVIHCEELGSSFLGKGLSEYSRAGALTLTCERISQIAETIDTPKVREFLARYIPLAASGGRRK